MDHLSEDIIEGAALELCSRVDQGHRCSVTAYSAIDHTPARMHDIPQAARQEYEERVRARARAIYRTHCARASDIDADAIRALPEYDDIVAAIDRGEEWTAGQIIYRAIGHTLSYGAQSACLHFAMRYPHGAAVDVPSAYGEVDA